MDGVNYTSLDTTDLDPGTYTLVVKVTDTLSGWQASKAIAFGVAASE
mgnify:CR=1 FL=1|jgi:hypothetical protein